MFFVDFISNLELRSLSFFSGNNDNFDFFWQFWSLLLSSFDQNLPPLSLSFVWLTPFIIWLSIGHYWYPHLPVLAKEKHTHGRTKEAASLSPSHKIYFFPWHLGGIWLSFNVLEGAIASKHIILKAMLSSQWNWFDLAILNIIIIIIFQSVVHCLQSLFLFLFFWSES